jgi:hypothetical protein
MPSVLTQGGAPPGPPLQGPIAQGMIPAGQPPGASGLLPSDEPVVDVRVVGLGAVKITKVVPHIKTRPGTAFRSAVDR